MGFRIESSIYVARHDVMPVRQFFLLAVVYSPIDEGILSLFKGSVIFCHFDLLAADQAAAEVVPPSA
jgi:hypothetical protein